MITVLTSHNDIYNKDVLAVNIIKEYQTNHASTIFLNNEGPSAESVGLYQLLDNLCNTLGFDKSKITIITCNAEELHNEYRINIKSQHWFNTCVQQYRKFQFNYKQFKNNKIVDKNLFGCLYNIPSWNRLSLLSYIKFKTKSPSLLACNVSMTEGQHNTLGLNRIINECPTEFFNIVEYLKTSPEPLPGHPGHKPELWENMEITKFYNDFFIDIVAETYTDGLTFFVTEKTIRPMLALTPFITYGPQGFLSNLRARYGFKTFNRWWDENYDNFSGYERVKEMYKVIDYLDLLSLKERNDMYLDMQETLDYNFKIINEKNIS